jgi:hypothetical protein
MKSLAQSVQKLWLKITFFRQKMIGRQMKFSIYEALDVALHKWNQILGTYYYFSSAYFHMKNT